MRGGEAQPGPLVSEEEFIDEVAAVAHGDGSGQRWLAMLRLCLDDGGSQFDAKKPVFAVAGYITDSATWKAFTQQWETVRASLNAPPYHGTDAEYPGHRDFVGWDKDALITLKHSLATVIRERRLVGVGRTVVVPDYNAIIRGDPLLAKLPGGQEQLPVVFCLRLCMEWIGRTWPDRPPHEQVAIIFESGTRGAGTAALHFEQLRQESTWAGSVFVSFTQMSKSIPALQAADMFAYEVYKEAERRAFNPGRAERPLLTLLRSEGLIDVKHADRISLERIVRAFHEQLGH